jgi:GT2 family glycosyltransferase
MKVSVLIAHEEAASLLKVCLESLQHQTFKDFETILVSSNHKPDNAYTDKSFHSDTRLHFPAAIAKAYEMSDPTSEYILLLNDDAIMSSTCLKELVETMEGSPQEIILGPRSNCGPIMGFYFTTSGFYSGGNVCKLPTQFRFSTIEPFIYDLIHNQLSYPFGVFQVPFSPFFCTLMKRSTYEKVGRIEERFRTGADDKEFADRALRFGIRCYVALHASVAHASGVSADLSLTMEDRAFNISLLRELS